jgi:hypothetical protein
LINIPDKPMQFRFNDINYWDSPNKILENAKKLSFATVIAITFC